jgi:hypothetical protein
MKNAVLFVSMFLGALEARADGFRCQTADESLNITVYNQTSRDAGTRNAAVLIVSDPTVATGNRTIARFTADETLDNTGSSYDARVDLRYKDSNRRGEYIGGTRLGELRTINLDVAFSYANPVVEGSDLPAVLTLVKRDGDEIVLDATCARYLAN